MPIVRFGSVPAISILGQTQAPGDIVAKADQSFSHSQPSARKVRLEVTREAKDLLQPPCRRGTVDRSTILFDRM
jgi:hypothetical protein